MWYIQPPVTNLELMVHTTKPFKFTNSLLRRSELKELVEEAWRKEVNDENAMYTFMMWLRNAKRVLRDWERTRVNNPSELKKSQERLESRKRDLLKRPFDVIIWEMYVI